MRKVWQLSRNGIPGVYVEWYDEDHRRRSKYFGPKYKRYAKEFMARKFAELNADVRPVGCVLAVAWKDFVAEYVQAKDAAGLKRASLVEIEHTLKIFHAATDIQVTSQLTTRVIADFIRQRREGVSANTLNKDIRNLKTLIAWGQRRRYVGQVEVRAVRAEGKKVRVLSDAEVAALLGACGSDAQWRMRILLALCTGFRRSTLDGLRVADFDLIRKTVSVVDRKTGKATSYQPLPDDVVPEIKAFLADHIAQGQVRFFKYSWSKKWYDLLDDAGLKGRIEFHDLRRTFGSMQAEAGVPIKALQEMYNHAKIETTMRHYIATSDPVKRTAVNKLNVKSWLQPR